MTMPDTGWPWHAQRRPAPAPHRSSSMAFPALPLRRRPMFADEAFLKREVLDRKKAFSSVAVTIKTYFGSSDSDQSRRARWCQSGATAGESVCAGRAAQQHPRWLAPGPAWISCRCPTNLRARGAVPRRTNWSPARRLFGRGRHRPRTGKRRSGARAGAKWAWD